MHNLIRLLNGKHLQSFKLKDQFFTIAIHSISNVFRLKSSYIDRQEDNQICFETYIQLLVLAISTHLSCLGHGQPRALNCFMNPFYVNTNELMSIRQTHDPLFGDAKVANQFITVFRYNFSRFRGRQNSFNWAIRLISPPCNEALSPMLC